MTSTPATVGEELFQRLRGFLDEPEMVELTTAIAHENLRSRFNRAFDVQAADFSEGAFCPLPEGSAPADSSPGQEA